LGDRGFGMSLRSVDAVRRLRILWASLNNPNAKQRSRIPNRLKNIWAVSLFLENVQRE
jgi:hypothetical protein